MFFCVFYYSSNLGFTNPVRQKIGEYEPPKKTIQEERESNLIIDAKTAIFIFIFYLVLLPAGLEDISMNVLSPGFPTGW